MLNQAAEPLVQQIMDRHRALGIMVHDDGVNVPVIDGGVQCRGSLGAGLAMARICTAGQAEIDVATGTSSLWAGPQVTIQTDQPVAACMASQYAGWKIEHEGYFAMGSGPMRAAAGAEALFDIIGHRESPSMAFGVLESAALPSPHVCQQIAADCNVEHRRLTLFVAPTTSLAGTVQIVARSVETALHKLHELKFDLTQVVSAWGVAPLPPVAADPLTAIGRTNDAILYGGRVQLWVDGDDEQLKQLIDKVPSSASKQAGQPFAEIFKSQGSDFYNVDPLLFSPAWIRINNLKTGTTFTAGQPDTEILRKSFLGSA